MLAGFRFPREVISLAVRRYLRYSLSYRDVEELLAERGTTGGRGRAPRHGAHPDATRAEGGSGLAQKVTDASCGGRPWLAGEAIGMASRCPVSSATRCTGLDSSLKRIEQDGYKSVQNLQKGDDGLWHGTAMRGNASVQVTVDRAGHVSAQ